jgi:DNA-binding SARP family transcriptional activator
MIRCRVLGPVEVEVNGGPAPAELLWRKHLALLLYLARSPRQTRTREHLTGLLWPDKEESAARHSLNEALRILRRTAGEDAIDTGAGKVRLAEGVVRLDCDDLEGHLAQGAWAEASNLIAGSFLEGFSLPDSGAFEDWLAAERRALRERSLAALLGWSEALLRQGDAAGALRAAERAGTLDPLSDAALRARLSALSVQGEIARAMETWESFSSLVRQELGSEPSRDTRAYAERIGSSRGPRAIRKTAEPELRRAPLVGRKRELSAILECLEKNKGSAIAVVIEGDSGCGKSRLLDELRARLSLGGVATVFVRAVEADRTQEESGLLAMARGGLLDAPGAPAANPEALATLGRLIPEWGDRFRTATGSVPLPAAIASILEAAVDAGPVALLIDDAHWLDRSTLLTLTALLRNLGRMPFLVAVTTAPQPAREEIDQLRARIGSDVTGIVVSLAPLDQTALGELVAWAFPGFDGARAERISRRISSDSAGLPLLAVELISAVAAGLEIRDGEASWPAPFRTLTETLPGDLPDTIVAAIRIGFRRLSQEGKQVLVAAAVVGTEVNEELMVRATGLELPQVRNALDELEWQRWLECDGKSYGFVARIAARVIERDMVTKGQRTRILQRAVI